MSISGLRQATSPDSRPNTVGHVRPTRSEPTFPASALGYWLASFCAVVALITVWGPHISLATKIGATALFFVVPAVMVAFWLGQKAEYRAAQDHNPQSHRGIEIGGG
jgi:hypothetical protein